MNYLQAYHISFLIHHKTFPCTLFQRAALEVEIKEVGRKPFSNINETALLLQNAWFEADLSTTLPYPTSTI